MVKVNLDTKIANKTIKIEAVPGLKLWPEIIAQSGLTLDSRYIMGTLRHIQLHSCVFATDYALFWKLCMAYNMYSRQ